jgi:Ca-activated chloride channel family protein
VPIGHGVTLALPWALLLAAPVAWLVARLAGERRRAPRLRLPTAAAVRAAGPGPLARVGWLPGALLAAALALAAAALARPQRAGDVAGPASVEGIDIVVALDLSTSMLAADFQPRHRLHVAKAVLKEFVGRRESDRIGLVTFAGEAYTQAPLTLDHAFLREVIDGLEPGDIPDGTAIGNALATALNRLRESAARSRVVILVTDGDSNAGQLAPLEAADMAERLGVKVFTILVGRGGKVPYPYQGPLGTVIYRDTEIPVNPDLLREMARRTGGAHYSAVDRASLAGGLNDILDRLERSRILDAGTFRRVEELFPRLLAPAFWLAALALLLGATRLRSFP